MESLIQRVTLSLLLRQYETLESLAVQEERESQEDPREYEGRSAIEVQILKAVYWHNRNRFKEATEKGINYKELLELYFISFENAVLSRSITSLVRRGLLAVPKKRTRPKRLFLTGLGVRVARTMDQLWDEGAK